MNIDIGRAWLVATRSLLGACLCLVATAAIADEIKVLSAGAAKAALTDLVTSFHVATGHHVVLTFATVGNIRERLDAGEAADMVIVSKEALDDMERAQLTVPGARIDLGQVLIGVAVKEGAPLPDISTPEAFKRALLAAVSIAAVDPAKGGTSGIHFAKVLEQLGIADQVRGKMLLLPGGYVADAIAKGEIEIGVQQISEILPVAGVQLVGPLPAELQKTTTYTGGIVRHTKVPQAATSFLRYLAGRAGRAKFAATGFSAAPK